MTRKNVVPSFCWSLLLAACAVAAAGGALATPGDQSDSGRKFDRARIGMTAEEILTTMGPPSKTLVGREGESWTRAYVWERRKHLVTKETAVAVFDGDRVVMMINSSGGMDDIRKHINNARRRSIDDREVAVPSVTAERDAWARIPYMVSRLEEESEDEVTTLEGRLAAGFDRIERETSETDIVQLLGEATSHKTKRSKSTYTWKQNGEKLVVIFENGMITEKSIETDRVEFTVKEGYWKARRRDSGLEITVYL